MSSLISAPRIERRMSEVESIQCTHGDLILAVSVVLLLLTVF